MMSAPRARIRQLSSVLAAVLLATAFSAAVPATAGARSAHCKSPCPHCRTSSAMTCCDTDRSAPSSLPPKTSTVASGADQLFAVPSFMGAASAVGVATPTLALQLPGLPHGYRSVDLPILNSVFLI